MTTPGHAHVQAIARQARDWHTARSLAAAHAVTVTTTGVGTLTEIVAVCACGCWTAGGMVNEFAPAYDPQLMPTRLRALHRDHQTDVVLDGDAGIAAEWDTVLATLQASS